MGLEDDLDAIASEPLAPRAPLDFTRVHRLCVVGVHSALDQVRRGYHESAVRKLTEHVRALEHTDASSSTTDAWARMGAVAGAVDMWRQEWSRPPQDCPSPAHMLMYCGAWAFAATCVAWAAGPAMTRGVR